MAGWEGGRGGGDFVVNFSDGLGWGTGGEVVFLLGGRVVGVKGRWLMLAVGMVAW